MNEFYKTKNLSISVQPVKWEQVLTFYEDPQGFKNDKWWNGLALENKRWHQDNKAPSSPAHNINWYTAIAYCRWLSEKLNENFRLPTETEWLETYKHIEIASTDDWCINKSDDPKRVDYSSGKWKPVLGTTYLNHQDGIHRKCFSPINTFSFVGFRVVKPY